MGTSAPPQALPHTSMGALQLKAQEGAASASLVREVSMLGNHLSGYSKGGRKRIGHASQVQLRA
eukprot:scaffold143263_cov12-Tisochrysis_lutea.AAC.1